MLKEIMKAKNELEKTPMDRHAVEKIYNKEEAFSWGLLLIVAGLGFIVSFANEMAGFMVVIASWLAFCIFLHDAVSARRQRLMFLDLRDEIRVKKGR